MKWSGWFDDAMDVDVTAHKLPPTYEWIMV